MMELLPLTELHLVVTMGITFDFWLMEDSWEYQISLELDNYPNMWPTMKIGYRLNDYFSQVTSIFFHNLTLIPINICIQGDPLPLPFQIK